MPHIIVKLYPGRSDDVKKEFADKVALLAEEVLGSGVDHTSVAFFDIEKDKWQTDVVDAEIMPNKDRLFKKSIYINE